MFHLALVRILSEYQSRRLFEYYVSHSLLEHLVKCTLVKHMIVVVGVFGQRTPFLR